MVMCAGLLLSKLREQCSKYSRLMWTFVFSHFISKSQVNCQNCYLYFDMLNLVVTYIQRQYEIGSLGRNFG